MVKSKHKFRQGVYTIKNREKYLGKKAAIFRSSWELKMMEYLDNKEGVEGWCSECVIIPYTFNGKVHRYFPDFLVVWKDGRKQVIEVKPHRETMKPRKTKKKSRKTMLYEELTYCKNQAKWEAAEGYCKKKGWEFKILTEKHLII